MTVRRGTRRKQLLDDLKEQTGYWKLKEEAPEHKVWRFGFRRGYGSVTTEITECTVEPVRIIRTYKQ